ncbi:glycosyltransferase family 2 protein [Maribacter sp. 4U21]|uniref:glycosyltransferase family 2 protein n=1 Tax=Maribacter sp. 4U21 TaxID=1889779 RepID=UPI0015D4C532|nr:glycosyltransferase family A protein [Maribacter sp. 4U21]
MFSVITPTYNRAHTLERVFNSLKQQSNKDFEWIIVDDASTDNTKKLVKSWVNLNLEFSIKYYLLDKNKGKPNALNVGLEYCSRPFTVIADSDDTFVSNTIEDLQKLWQMVDISDNANRIASIWTLVKNERGELVGEPFPSNFWQVDLKGRILNRKAAVQGEKWHSWRTTVLRKYKMFHSDFSFISEGSTWNRINKDYDFLCINIIHRIYFSSPDGLILKEKTRLELEKIKFYSSYYQLYQTPNWQILKYKYYQIHAFDHIKSILTYRDPHMNLSSTKILFCVLVTLWNTPKRLFYFLTLKLQK